MDQQFYDFDLITHIRGCMSLAMERSDNDLEKYYDRIKIVYSILGNNLEDIFYILLIADKKEKLNIWVWAAIGELFNIKDNIDLTRATENREI